MKRFIRITMAVLFLASLMVTPALASTVVSTPNGSWFAYPGQAETYQASVQQPINADGSSNFKANGKAVIPVKFALAEGTGAFVFESIFSDSSTANDYSYLFWEPAAALSFADIAQLSAVYAFTDGDCAGGSLRWTVYLDDNGTTRNLDIHYQPGAGGLSQQTCAPGTSGANLIGSTDAIYVTQEFNGGYSFPSAYNNTYADALSQLGSLPVLGMNLILDSGWGANGDQVVALSSATVGVGGANGYTETFTPQPASPVTAICPSAQATISIYKTDGAPLGAVNEPLTIQPQDNDGIFRIVDCKYMYNLATSSLSGAGSYTVYATIGSTTFMVGSFDLR
jgi:hypothetical protein